MQLTGIIIFGALIGWTAALLVGFRHEQHTIRNVLVGVVGAFIGNSVVQQYARYTQFDSYILWSFLAALGGATTGLVVYNALCIYQSRRRMRHYRPKPLHRQPNITKPKRGETIWI